MKLSELNAKAEQLKAERLGLWQHLDRILADDAMSVAERRAQEAAVREGIKALNEQLYPIEQERAEIDRVVKGKPRKRAESWLDVEVSLG